MSYCVQGPCRGAARSMLLVSLRQWVATVAGYLAGVGRLRRVYGARVWRVCPAIGRRARGRVQAYPGVRRQVYSVARTPPRRGGLCAHGPAALDYPHTRPAGIPGFYWLSPSCPVPPLVLLDVALLARNPCLILCAPIASRRQEHESLAVFDELQDGMGR